MTYRRTLPRDLFNEADLLKCMGRLWIAVHETQRTVEAGIVEEDVDAFRIVQDDSSGAIRVDNLTFRVDGTTYRLERPLNARGKWPLYLSNPDNDDFDEIRVFDEEGHLSAEMRILVGG